MEIRDFEPDDWSQMWPFMNGIIRRGDTFCYEPDLSETDARRVWLVEPPGRVVVAFDDDEVVGTSTMYPNRPGPGRHIAGGSFMVAPAARGSGVGRALGTDMLAWARRSGFRGLQFNAVAESNEPAATLYLSLGFVTIGTVPGAFRHPQKGDVGLHVMFHDLS